MKINIKPLSVNAAWQGRRFKSEAYKNYEKELLLRLPNKINIPEGNLFISLEFGFSALNDWDNGIKTFQDVLAKKYNFNDRRIKGGIVLTNVVKKGDEYIKFELLKYDKN